MTNPGAVLETISETGEVPESRLTDPVKAQEYVQRLIQKDGKRSYKRSRLNGLVDGNPPYRASRLKDMARSDASNANWGTSRAYMESGSGAFYDLFSESPGFFKVRTAAGTPDENEVWSRGLSANADRVIRGANLFVSEGKDAKRSVKKKNVWDYNMQLSQWDMVLHGCGPMMFEDEFCVLPKAFLCDDLKVPEFTKSDTEYWDAAAVIATYYPPQLYDFIRNEKIASDKGWNVSFTKEFITRAMNLRTAQSNQNEWVFYQQELKNNAMAYYDDTLVCKVAHLYWKEFNGKVTHVIVPTTSSTGTEIKFLFRHVGRYQDFSECIHPMYWDHGNGGYHHSVTGLGVKMFSGMETQERMINNLVDKAFSPKLLFKPTTAESSQKFSLVNYGDYAVLPANFEWQQTGVAGLMEEGLAMHRELSETMRSNLSNYRQPSMPRRQGNPVTATQDMREASEQSALSKTQFNRYYEQLDCLAAEIFRRLCIKDSTDKRAQEFQRRCKDLNIPPEAYYKLESVEAVRVVGQGSAFMRRQSLTNIWVGIGPGLPEDGRTNLADDLIAAEAGQSAVARYNPRRNASTLPSDQQAEAVQWIGIMKTGVPPIITSTQNPVIYAMVWMQAAEQAAASMEEGANPIEVLAFLDVIGPAIGAQLQRFEADKMRQQIFKAIEKKWRELAQFTEQLRQEISKQREAQQAQMEQTQQVMSDEQLKELTVTSNIRRKDLTTNASLQQKDQKMRQKLQEDAQQHAQRLALADADTAAGIERENLKAQAQAKSRDGE